MSLKGNCRVDYKSNPTKLERLFCLWVYKYIPAKGEESFFLVGRRVLVENFVYLWCV